MKLHYYRSEVPNFGDDINPWFWEKAFGLNVAATQEKNESVLLGIGTLINDLLPKAATIHILGSGAGYGNTIPSVKDNWIVHFVRGPLTAKRIGVDTSKVITDPVILLYDWIEKASVKHYKHSFMPHYAINSIKLKRAVERAGIHYISPSDKRDDVIDQVNRSENLITSAMHGSILAEALRVPWHPVITSPEILSFKWKDFLYTLDLEYNPTRLTTIWPEFKKDIVSRSKMHIKEALVSNELKSIIKKGNFYLSDDLTIINRVQQLRETIGDFKENYLI